MKIFLPFLIILVANSYLLGQSIQPQFGASYRQYARTEIVDILGSNRYEGVEIGHSEIALFGNFETNLGENTSLFHSIDYTLYQFTYQNWPNGEPEAERPDRLHALNYNLSLRQKFANSWRFILDVKPGIATDFQKDRAENDFIFQGAARIQKLFREDESFLLGIGASYNTLLGEASWLPTLDFYWQSISQKFYTDINFPFKGEAAFLPSEKFKLGLIGRVTGNQFNFVSPVADNFALNATHGGAFLSVNVKERVWLQLEGGLIINRTYEGREGDKTRTDLDPDKLEPYYLQVSMVRLLKK